jgi:alpha-N-arabinofuranosidase
LLNCQTDSSMLVTCFPAGPWPDQSARVLPGHSSPRPVPVSRWRALFKRTRMAIMAAGMATAVMLPAGIRAQNRITLRPDTATVRIDPNIYGHFAEHLGRCIYGGFYVGEKSSIPNINGIRKDVVEALRKLKVPVLRWPGGCFADTYHWKDGIGPKASRPTIVNTNWGGVTEDNSFGTHDFLRLCELLQAEPYLAGNIGSGTVQELADWVQYTNFEGNSPMSNLRQKNGRTQPWAVKYWGVGNEAWGCGGNMTPEYYANEFRKFATFMPDSKTLRLSKIASGANGGDYNWTEVLMKNIPLHLLGGVGVHHYSVIKWTEKGSATNFSEQQYFATLQSALYMDTIVTRHAAIMDKYDPRKKVAMVVDEWGGWYDVEPGTNPGFLYQQNTLRDAMIAGSTLNIFNNHADRVRMANLAQAINVLQAVILTDQQKLVLTPTYHVMEMYNVHQGATLLPLQVQSEDYVLDGKKLKAVNASASRDSAGIVHISLVNIDARQAKDLTIDLGALPVQQLLPGRILTAAALQDRNTFEQPGKIVPAAFSGARLNNRTLTLQLPPHSVVVLALK